MTGKVTVKENKSIHVRKNDHARNGDPKKSCRLRVDVAFPSIYILLETG